MAATLALRICANFLNIRYINARRVSPSNGEMRFFYFDFRNKGDASNINKPQYVANGGCMATKVLVKECQYAEFKQS